MKPAICQRCGRNAHVAHECAETIIELPGELLRACGRDLAFRDVIAAVESLDP
jgi:hypothetical protein